MIEVERRASSIGDGGDDSSATPPGSDQTRENAEDVFPLLALRGLVAFPHVSYPIFVGRPTSIKAVLHAKERNVPIVLATQKDMEISNPSSSNMYEVGTIGRMIEVIHLPDGTLKTVAESRKRVRITRFIFTEDISEAEVEEIDESGDSNPRLESLVTSVISALVQNRLNTVRKHWAHPEQLSVSATTTDGASVLADRTPRRTGGSSPQGGSSLTAWAMPARRT